MTRQFSVVFKLAAANPLLAGGNAVPLLANDIPIGVPSSSVKPDKPANGPPEDGTGAVVLKDVRAADHVVLKDARAADYYEVVSRLLKGEFDIVHYSGHATFEKQYPDRTGGR